MQSSRTYKGQGQRSKKRVDFYNSRRWRKTSRYIKTIRYGICEKCGDPGTEVHHIIHLNDANIDDYNISLNPDNLMLLCVPCHNKIHGGNEISDEIEFDANGDVIPKKNIPPLSKWKNWTFLQRRWGVFLYITEKLNFFRSSYVKK